MCNQRVLLVGDALLHHLGVGDGTNDQNSKD
jgi:hypothetical protein